MPYLAQDAHHRLKGMNKDSQIETLNGSLGHLEGVTNVLAQADAIKTFLEKD